MNIRVSCLFILPQVFLFTACTTPTPVQPITTPLHHTTTPQSSPTQIPSVTSTFMPTMTREPSKPFIPSPISTKTQEPRKELGSKESAELLAIMPKMVFYDHVKKAVAEYSKVGIRFFEIDSQNIAIYDGSGKQIGYLRHVTIGNLTDRNWFSLTDEAKGLIPIRLFTQVTVFGAQRLDLNPKLVFAFSSKDDYQDFILLKPVPDYVLDLFPCEKFDPDGAKLLSEMWLKVVGKIFQKSQEELKQALSQGHQLLFQFPGVDKVDLAKGVDLVYVRDHGSLYRQVSPGGENGRLVLWLSNRNVAGNNSGSLLTLSLQSFVLNTFGEEFKDIFEKGDYPCLINLTTSRDPLLAKEWK